MTGSKILLMIAQDIHGHTLGEGKNDDSLNRAKDIKGELVMIFGKRDTHVPPEGRDLIRKTLHEAGVTFSFYEVAWAQRMQTIPCLIPVVNFSIHSGNGQYGVRCRIASRFNIGDWR